MFVFHLLFTLIFICTGHKHSDYKFEWHHKDKKEEFVTDKLWKAGRAIKQKRMAGWKRISYILELSGKDNKVNSPSPTMSSSSKSLSSELGVSTKSAELHRRVLAVMAAVSSKSPLSIFDNDAFRRYLHELNPNHRPPYRLERVRMLEVIMDMAANEFVRILEEQRAKLVHSFLSVQTDMWTDPHRREQFAALLVSLVANQYQLRDGRKLFMSKDTAKALHNNGELLSVRLLSSNAM